MPTITTHNNVYHGPESHAISSKYVTSLKIHNIDIIDAEADEIAFEEFVELSHRRGT